MKVLAAFSGLVSPNVIVRQIEWMAHVPGAEFTFLSLALRPHETARRQHPSRPVAAVVAGPTGTLISIASMDPDIVEDKGQAIDRALVEHSEYLERIVTKMPPGPAYRLESDLASDPAKAIIEYATKHRADVIVLGTHHGGGILHRLFGDVTEDVVIARVAPVLLLNPE